MCGRDIWQPTIDDHIFDSWQPPKNTESLTTFFYSWQPPKNWRPTRISSSFPLISCRISAPQSTVRTLPRCQEAPRCRNAFPSLHLPEAFADSFLDKVEQPRWFNRSFGSYWAINLRAQMTTSSKRLPTSCTTAAATWLFSDAKLSISKTFSRVFAP